MALRPNPFDEMERMMEQMRHSAFGDHSRAGGSNITLEKTQEDYVVFADLPGFEKEELDLRYEDGHLTIRAEHEIEDEYEAVGARTRSARHRQVHERVRVPAEIHEDGITASYRNGVLEVHLPTVEDIDDSEHVTDIE